MKSWQKMLCLGLLLGAPLGLARGAEFNMNVTAEGISLGEHIAGPKLTGASLKDRVVLIEFWGIN
jgi:hypothetical protein